MAKEKKPTLRFLGAAGTVTGSKHLLRTPNAEMLLLDCGLFQGLKDLRLRNWQPPPFPPQQLSAVVLSHAHIDHSGYLPLAVRHGFRGPIHCTRATADLLGVMLPDSAHLQEEEAEFANRQGYSKHHPALPLYNLKDAELALQMLQPHDYDQAFAVGEGTESLFRRAGHILGAATVELRFAGAKGRQPQRLVFSGDLGRYDRPILHDPTPVPHADWLILESTYGDRQHPQDVDSSLARIVHNAVQRGGALIVPAFAVGRTQELIWRLHMLEAAGQIPQLPVYVDSPMATNVTQIYCQHPQDHDLDMQQLRDEHRSPLASRRVRFIRSVEESKALNHQDGAMIIISASGMATGGRVLHHLEQRLPDPRNTVLLVGFQAAGTRGRSLQEGAKTLRMFGRDVSVRARIEWLDGLSAHADQNETLRWLAGFKQPPRQTYLVHGEPQASAALAKLIAERLHWLVRPAKDGETVILE